MDSSKWNFEATNLAVFLIPSVVIPTILLILAFLQPTKRQMNRWAAVCGVALTDTNHEQVRAHLTRVRRFRSVAAFPFWWLAWLPLINTAYPTRFATPFPAITAYLAGALLAEVTGNRVRTPATAERRAALLTRTVDDYGPRWIRTFPYVLVAAGALSVVLAEFLDGTDVDATAAVTVALAAAFSGGSLLVGYTIVRRPQRGSEPDVLAADDALRSAGVSTAFAAASLSGIVAAWTGIGSVMPVATGVWGFLLLLPVSLAAYGATIGLLMLIIRQEALGHRKRHRQARTATEAVPA